MEDKDKQGICERCMAGVFIGLMVVFLLPFKWLLDMSDRHPRATPIAVLSVIAAGIVGYMAALVYIACS